MVLVIGFLLLVSLVLSAGLAANLMHAASGPNAPLTKEAAIHLAENPSALVSPEARAAIGPRATTTLQESLARATRTVFAASAVMVLIALIFGFMLPRDKPGREEDGEKFVMAEMAVMDAENEPESAV